MTLPRVRTTMGTETDFYNRGDKHEFERSIPLSE